MSKADRYISQNALIKEIAKIHGNLSTKNVGQAIWDTPTADAVEVVRCKDCAYCRYVDGAGIYRCDRRGYYSEEIKPFDYCSYGERRTENEG